MAKKYAWETDEQKKSSSKRYAWDDGTIANTVSADITNRVNTWLQNHSNYVTNHRNRYVGRKFNYEDTFRKDSKSWLDTVSKQADAFEAERQSILSYMDQYNGYLDEEWANSVRNALTTGSNAQKQIRDSATKDNEYWNSFGSDKELVKKYGSAEGVYQYAQRADGYRNKYSGMSNSELTKARVLAVGNAMKSIGDDSSYAKEEAEWLNSYVAGKEYDELLRLDEEKEKKQIDHAYKYLNDIDSIAYWAMDVGLTPDNMDRYVPTTAEDEENFANYKAMVNRHGDLYKADKAVRANIADMEGRIKSSDHVKEQYKWMSVSDPGSENYDQNFDYYSKIGASKIDNPINSTGINKFLEEDEVSIYNYYLGKFGEDKANQYLSTLSDVLRYRQGNSWAESIQGIDDIVLRTGAGGLLGLASGVEQFGRGVGQLFSNEELDASSLMYANAEIANDLDGFNALAYQGTNVVGNMLPSIALSAATAGIGGAAGLSATAASSLGTLAGTGSMSLSAMGNAYVDGLNYGMSTGEARTYGTLVGLAEGAMEYLIGGIPGLSKADDFVTAKIGTIKNGLLRSGSKIGWNVIQEIGEEELQNFLEPAFRAIFTGEYDAPTAEELIETAIVTALSTSGMSAADTKINDAHANRAMVKTGKDIMKREGGVDSLLEQADYLAGVTTGYDQKSLMKQTENVYKKTESESKSKSKSTAREVGKLANAVQTTTDSQSHASFVQTLTSGENGFSKKDANRIADALVAHSNGRELTEDQVELLMSVKSNPAVQSIVESNSRKNIEKLRTLLEKENLEEPAAYKSLTDRVGDEGRFGVSESGKAVIRSTDEEIDINALDVATVGDGQLTFKVGDREVSAGDIDFADDNQSFLVSAVSNIENITAKDATAIIHDVVDMSKPLGMQINGIDEAYTYGFHGYSVEDLKAGEFGKILTDKQLMSAYELGKAARRDSVEVDETQRKKMRTAADAKMTAEQKTAQQKARIESDDVEVYFMDGDKVVKFDEHTGKYDDKRKAAINTAKFLRKLGIGGKYYFFESYLSETLKDEDGNALRVYKDADGNEVEAPNGIYDNGSIYIDLNAGDAGQGTALFTMGHELTHFIKDQSKKQFKVLCDIVKEAFDKTDLSMHERVLEKQKFLEDKRGEEVSYDEAYEEVVADAMSTMLTDGSFYEKIMEIKVKDKGLFNTIKRFFEKLIAKFTKAYEELTPDQKDAQDIRAMKDMFDKIQTAFAEALVEASDNFHAAMESVVEENVEPISSDEIITDGAVVTDGNGEKQSLRSMKHDIAEGKMFEDLKNVCGWTNAQVNTLRTQLKDLVEYMIPFRDILDMNESYGREGRRFSPYKPNSDPLYKISMDFSTLCSKRLLTQYVIESLQIRENRPMSPEEQMAIRDMLNEYRKVEKGLQVACAMCYVEAARLKSPKQIQRWLDDPTPHLINYFALKNTEFNASVKEAQADFKESRGYDRNAPKKDMKPADVTALNKIGPKLRSQYQLSAEEQAIVERAKTLPNSTYLTAGNLATLSETDPVLYAAYTSFVRTATRSKSLETDEPYYYGDSTRDNGNGIIVSDSFIEAVNRENGMRFSSWSDWRIQHLLDYITAVIDNSVRGAAMHGYTKFGDEVRVLGKTGMMFNMSGVTGTQTGLNEDGSLNFSDTESIDVNEAIQLREEFPEHAGLQCIGVSNEHIIALLRSDIIDYVIPYHVSGLNAALRRMADIYGWKDYTGTQHASIDKSIKFENAVDKEHWHEEPVFSEFFVGYDTKMSGIEAMMASAEKYKQLCKDRGLTPKFNQFAAEENYWKLLIDRKMINQQTGNLIRQKAVTPTFDFDTIKGVVDKYVQNYDAGLEARALNHIVENWDSIPQRIKDLKKQGSTKAKKTKNAVDTLANQTVAAQPKGGTKNSDRKVAKTLAKKSERNNAPTFYSQMGKVVEGMKQEKFGASSVISMLRGRGVKAEEIRWSGIQAFIDGKKSVTKAELQEFIAGSMLQIEEETLSNKERPYSQEHLDQIAKYEAERDIIVENLKSEWKRIIGTDIPINYFGAGLESSVVEKLLAANTEKKGDTDAGYQYKAAKAALQRCIEYNADYFGFDNERQAFREAVRNPKDFMNSYEMSSFEKGVFRDFIKAQEAYRKVEGIPLQDQKALKAIAESADRFNRRIAQVKSEHRAKAAKHMAKWEQYKLKGGENYREILFKIPGSTYYNQAMAMHWDERDGVLAHARIQDLNTFLGKMLFIEEIQSDWHNDGHKDGYANEETAVRKRLADLEKQWDDLLEKSMNGSAAESYAINEKMDAVDEEKRRLEDKLRHGRLAPDAPFRDNYHEYVLKRLIREAAENDYDSIGWTTADIQSKRWSDKYAEGYRIEYDQDIPKFLKKYGKQWGTTVGKTVLDNGTEVWSMAITDSMQKSVLKEGQALYSERGDGSSNRSLLANAFEGLSQNSDEYKMIQEYKGRIKLLNEQEAKLAKLNAEIREIRLNEGKYDAKKLKELETEAESVAESINRQDRKLLDMEVSEPFRKVIEQERKKEAQKTKAHVKEIQQNKKLRAEQTELRHKIRKAVRDLDKLLNRGNKKTNVKEDMKDFVSKALEIADYLFTDHISNDELIRKGITVRMTPREAALVKETEDIISKLDAATDINQPGSKLTDEEFTRLDAKRKANEDKLRDLLTTQRNDRLNTPVSKLFDDLVKAYASLKNSSQDAVKAAYNEELEKSLRAFVSDDAKVKILENMRVADMTTEELNWLYRAYTIVLTNVRNANKFHVKGMTETIDQKVDRIVSDFSGRKLPDKKLAIVVRNLSNKMGWDYEKLYYALDRIGSEAFTELIMNLANSENIVMADVIEAAAFRDEMVEKHGFNDWEINKKIDKEFLDNTGKKFKLTLGELMSLYAYSRRDGAWDHIEYGGFSFKDTPITENNSAASYKLSKAQCEAITNTLTKEQKAYVEDMQKFLSETMGAKGNEVSMMLYGIKMFGEKNYFPIHIDGRFMAQAKESQAKAEAGLGTMSNAGFTHAQNPNAKAPFVMEGFNEVWADHVNEMSRYHGTVPALEDIRRVMNRSSYSDAYNESMSVKAVMENSFGKDAVDYFDNLYREANSGAITDKLQRVPKKLLSLFRKNSVAYKLSVLVQQPTSIIRAYAMIDKKYFGLKGFGTITSGVIKAVSDKWTNAHTNAYNEMLKYAPGVTMAKEIGGFDTHTGGSIRSYLLDTNKKFGQKWKTGTALEKGKAALDLVDNNPVANLPNLADKIAWIEIWNACKRETVATHKDLVPNSEKFMQAVGERFTEVIRATQVYDSIFAKSPMLKSKYIGVQYLVSFMNEPNTVANMAESAVRDAIRGDWKSGTKKAVVLVYAALAVGLVKSLVYAMHDDDEDETYAEKYIEALVGSLVSDFNPLSYIPIARDASSALQGYDIERPDVAIIVDVIEALKATYDNANKDTENMTEAQLAELEEKKDEATWKVVESVAAFLGIPVKNIRKDVMGIFNTVFNKTEIDTTKLSLIHAFEAALNNSRYFFLRDEPKSKQDKLYEAMLSGDKSYLARLKSTYKDDAAYHTAVRKALRENDSRIKEAAKAHINGDPSERVRIAKQIIADGFDLNDVILAINSEISELTPDKDSSGTEKVKGYYKVEDFVREAANGDTASLGSIREDIIKTAQANGKTVEEAEKDFVSDVKGEAKEAYLAGTLDNAGAEKILLEHTDMDEEEVASKVSYWAFCREHPDVDLNETQVEKYHEFAEPADIPLDVFEQYVDGTSGLNTIYDERGDEVKSKRERVLEVIDSLPLTWQQKDALYLAHEYAESKIWDVPW